MTSPLVTFVLGPFDIIHHNSRTFTLGSECPIFESLSVLNPKVLQIIQHIYIQVTSELFYIQDQFDAFRQVIDKFITLHSLGLKYTIIQSRDEISMQGKYLFTIHPGIHLSQTDFYTLMEAANNKYKTPHCYDTFIPRFCHHLTETSWFTFWYLTLMYWAVDWQYWFKFRWWAFTFCYFGNKIIKPSPSMVPSITLEALMEHPSYTFSVKKLEYSYFRLTPDMKSYFNPFNVADGRFDRSNYQITWYKLAPSQALHVIRPRYKHFLVMGCFLVAILTLGYGVRELSNQFIHLTFRYLNISVVRLFAPSVYLSMLAYIYYRWLKVAYYGKLLGKPQPSILPNYQIIQVRSFASRPTLTDLWNACKWIGYPLTMFYFFFYYALLWLSSFVY